MLKYSFLLLFFSFSLTLSCQESDVPVNKSFTHEIGVNASYLINKLIDYSPDSSHSSPYILHYRFAYGKWGIKIGLGGRRKFSKDNINGFADSKSTLNYRLDISAGIDYQVGIAKGFSCNFGLDFIKRDIVYDYIEDSGYDKIELLNQFHGYGIGPVAGIRYYLNKHISIYTEAMFGMLFGTTNNARIFNNFPELNDNILQQKSEEILSILPSSILIIYQF